MYTNINLVVVNDNAIYIGLDGSKYCHDHPKNEIPELFPVVEVSAPTDPTLFVEGFHIELDDSDPENPIYNQVWDTHTKTQQELDAELESAQFNKIMSLYETNDSLVEADIQFTTAGGVTKIYQADKERSQKAMLGMLGTFPVATPNDFYWRSLDNTNVTPFTRADLQGLITAIGTRAFGYHQNLTTKVDAIAECETVEEVNDIEW